MADAAVHVESQLSAHVYRAHTLLRFLSHCVYLLTFTEAAFVGQTKLRPGLTCAHILKAQGEQNIFGDGTF